MKVFYLHNWVKVFRTMNLLCQKLLSKFNFVYNKYLSTRWKKNKKMHQNIFKATSEIIRHRWVPNLLLLGLIPSSLIIILCLFLCHFLETTHLWLWPINWIRIAGGYNCGEATMYIHNWVKSILKEHSFFFEFVI